MPADNPVLGELAGLAATAAQDPAAASHIAERIRSARGYRWVGLYAVGPEEIAAMAWTGSEPPAFARFPRTQGLCGATVAARAVVNVGDVRNDPRYLTTFGSTRSEIVVPVLDAAGEVVGLVDVESERANAFTENDARFLERCAEAIGRLFR
jgi:GAF domain-containing protein